MPDSPEQSLIAERCIQHHCASPAVFQANLSYKHLKILTFTSLLTWEIYVSCNNRLHFALILHESYYVVENQGSKSFTEGLWLRVLQKGFILTQGFNAPIICVQ